MVFILYKLYVLLPYTYPTPKLTPHRRRCISIFPQKNSLCMIYKRFKLWGHWKCPHKSPSPCNTCHTHVIIQICVLINHINMHTHTHIILHIKKGIYTFQCICPRVCTVCNHLKTTVHWWTSGCICVCCVCGASDELVYDRNSSLPGGWY